MCVLCYAIEDSSETGWDKLLMNQHRSHCRPSDISHTNKDAFNVTDGHFQFPFLPSLIQSATNTTLLRKSFRSLALKQVWSLLVCLVNIAFFYVPIMLFLKEKWKITFYGLYINYKWNLLCTKNTKNQFQASMSTLSPSLILVVSEANPKTENSL